MATTLTRVPRRLRRHAAVKRVREDQQRGHDGLRRDPGSERNHAAIGTLTLGGGASGTTAQVTIGAGGELKLGGNVTYSNTNHPNGASITGGTLSLLGDRTFAVNDSTGAAEDLTISAIIQNGDGTARSLTKTQAGTLVLSGANTYTGSTIVSNGTLKLGASGVIPNGAGLGNVTVNGQMARWTWPGTTRRSTD